MADDASVADRARWEAIAAERRRALEAAQREALAQMQAGVCCAGFRWNEIPGGTGAPAVHTTSPTGSLALAERSTTPPHFLTDLHNR
ncbi:uncharacterized protein AMSG_11282 [Thecamonas trahens ATCC 50062]|uniref:Uncharacterized protein n=1 Tax=Thecamonas trahens ATCC 50062 TaxID=461836 RepID=A0A0L0DUU2_THETB|nr:hypothetical protein AMSG_11282 [Thecamonas trahens ATCC 50062]KNC55841.1 hypothetical protein AMSG_11282 [Thecamonas trahens ATCC 50062]|eukprot:XP_013752818.1 hypothetical protein AMSG_11282 [Thecamonas trahens ATCC 50062]